MKTTYFNKLRSSLLLLLMFALFKSLSAQNPGLKSVVGQVSDRTGDLLIGASIKLKNETTGGVLTDNMGKFSITIPVTVKDPILVVSYVGYKTQEIKVGDQKQVQIILESEKTALDEIVVIGYGSVQKRDLTGAVEKADVDEISKAPIANFDEALAGRVAGVSVSFGEGTPGAQSQIIIRGANSLTQDNAPLYVVDGFPVETSMNNAIDPGDIASLEILKDASATAIYGARGANGVIIITTKKGKEGSPVVNYSGTYGLQEISNKMDLMNGYEFVKYQSEIRTATYMNTSYFLNGKTLDSYRGTGIDFQDYLFKRSPLQNHRINVSGGSKDTKYLISLANTNQEGILINSGYERIQGRINLEQKVFSWLNIGVNASYSSAKKYGSAPSESGISGTTNLLQNAWAYRPVAGNDIDLLAEFVDSEIDTENNFQVNPLLSAQNELRELFTKTLLVNSFAEIKLPLNLKLRSSIGYTGDNQRQDIFNNSLTRAGSPVFSRIGVNGQTAYLESNNWLNENILTYARNFHKKHSIDALIGFTMQERKSISNSVQMQNLPNESLGMSGLDEGLFNMMSASRESWTLMSFLSRANYNYDSKYYLTASIRADGSSKFAGGNRWSYFPSGAIMWRIKKENFFKNVNFISDAKVRVSWGKTGNNRVSEFAYLPQISVNPSFKYYFGNEAVSSSAITNLGNKDLEWEQTTQADVGLELSFLNNRISFSADLYRKTTDNLLLNAELPGSSGYSLGYKNIGTIQNKGLELTLNTTNIRSKKFSWSTNFNIAFNNSNVAALTDNQDVMLISVNSINNTWNNLPAYIARVNQPLGQMYGFVYQGTYKYDDFIRNGDTYLLKANIPYSISQDAVQPGDAKYKDINGDGVVNMKDATILGNGIPVHTGGMNNKFTFQNFDLSFLFQWSYGNEILNANKYAFEMFSGFSGNKYKNFMNRWTPENTESNIPRYNDGSGSYYSSYAIEDGSYIRLKTVTLGYTFPKKLITKLHLNNLKVFLSAQNLYTLTRYSGMDPEVSVRNSALTPGFDWSAYPTAKTVALNLQLSLK